MAIHPLVHGPNQVHAAAYDEAVNVEAWTEQATQTLHSVTISSPTTPSTLFGGGTGSFAIPLDDHHEPRQHWAQRDAKPVESANNPASSHHANRCEPIRRDNMKRREALLKGHEGSRRRQRWENDRLLNNPHAQPPLPGDWEVRPTHPTHSVPYYLAPLWDAGLKQHSTTNVNRHSRIEPEDEAATMVSKQLREKLKRARGAKGLLRDLEEEVRLFVKTWDVGEAQLDHGHSISDADSEDDDIVFVGRNGQIEDPPLPKRRNRELRKDKLVFDSLANDHGASFVRWLVHSIAGYYGLRTWSVTVGDPARREAYVGIQEEKEKASRRSMNPLPQPLWGLV